MLGMIFVTVFAAVCALIGALCGPATLFYAVLIFGFGLAALEIATKPIFGVWHEERPEHQLQAEPGNMFLFQFFVLAGAACVLIIAPPSQCLGLLIAIVAAVSANLGKTGFMCLMRELGAMRYRRKSERIFTEFVSYLAGLICSWLFAGALATAIRPHLVITCAIQAAILFGGLIGFVGAAMVDISKREVGLENSGDGLRRVAGIRYLEMLMLGKGGALDKFGPVALVTLSYFLVSTVVE